MILIKNGKILTMAGKSYEKGDVCIQGTKIIEVAENIEVKEGMQIIDATNRWVMPGIIEAHCHIGIIEQKEGFEGDDCNEITDPVTPYLKAIDGINPMDAAFDDAVQAGITTVMVGPGSANVVGGQFVVMKTKGSRNIEDLIVIEPAAMKVAFGENIKKAYNDLKKMPTTRMAIAALLREALFNAKSYADEKKAAAQGNKPFKADFRQDSWLPVLEKKIPLKAHAHRTEDILTAIRIAKAFDVNLTLDHCSEGHLIAEAVKASGFPAIVGPALTTRNKIEVQNMSFKTAGILHKAGVKVAITTDHPVTPIQSLPKCAGFAAKEGLGVEEGLKAITINAAEICGVADRVGSLEIGKDADITIFDGNPMETFTKTLYTIINGKVVFINEDLKEKEEDNE